MTTLSIEARRPEIVVAENENNKAIIADIASPWDHRVYEKEGEKIAKSGPEETNWKTMGD